MKFDVALIKPNKFESDLPALFKEGNTESISKIMEDCVEMMEVTGENMMEHIVEKIKLTDKLIADTATCYEDDTYVYQLCHLSLKDNNKDEDEDNINGLASYLVIGGRAIYGNAIVLKSKITEKGICTTDTITKDDLMFVLKNKHVHKGVKVDTCGSLTEFYFYSDPMDSQEDPKGWQWLEVPLSKFNLIVFVQLEPDQDKVNKKATKLVGNNRVHGSVLVATKSTENDFIDLTAPILTKLIMLAGQRMSARKEKKEENDREVEPETEKIDGLPVVKNRHCVLNKEYGEFKKICHGCKKEIESDDFSVCGGCYRMLYHNVECQKSDWRTHSGDCLVNKKSLNSLLNSRKESTNTVTQDTHKH